MNRQLQIILMSIFIAFNCIIVEGMNTNPQQTRTDRIRDVLREIIGDHNEPGEPNGPVEETQTTDTAQSKDLPGKAGERDPEAMYELGITYLEGPNDVDRDVPKALALLTQSAESGNSNAMLELAYIYQKGDGIDRDQSKALEWLRRAAEAGKSIAMLAFAAAVSKEHDSAILEEQNVKWVRKGMLSLEKAAEKGDCDAMRILGMAYQPIKVVNWGSVAGSTTWFSTPLLCTQIPGIDKNEGKSTEWYRRAISGYEKRAAAGDPEAMFWLGKMCELGLGVKEDTTKELDWYRKAAEAGHREGMVEHGWACYRTEDFENAFKSFNKAAEQGSAEALLSLGWLYSKGQGVSMNRSKAVELWRKAADRGHPQAMLFLGATYANGEGVIQDYQQAVSWYKKGADRGDATCMFGLGLMYSTGRGIASDPNEAIEWWTKGAEKEHAGCMANLGWIYLYGKGVQQDRKQAVYWLRKASDLGNEYAKKQLVEIGEIR
ncbi:MAG: tetratricopeptide repeat protein [Sedimentisphaerales bacterium]|jgi:TPR repeat protein